MSDYIDRQAAIDALCKVGCGSGYCGIPCDDVKVIEQLPTIEVEPKKQIPQKPITNGLSVRVLCPNCKSPLRTFVIVENPSFTGYEREGLRPNYCEDCGQAIDWSDM